MCGIKEKEIMLFSNKLFIYCSILCLFYPMGKAIVRDQHGCGLVSSSPQTAELVLFTSKLAQLECNWKLRLFKNWRWPKIFVMSRKKSLRFKAIVQGLAVLLLFALSVVLSITFFIAISVTIRFPFKHDVYDIKKHASAIAFLSLSMFQYSVFSQQMNAVNSIVRKPIILALMDTQLKLNCFKEYSSPELEFALVLLLLLCGDVEINPGPQGDGKGDNSTSESVDPGYASISVNEPLSMQIPSDDAAASNNISHTSEHLVSNSVSPTSQNKDYVQFNQEPLEPQNNDVEDESPGLQPIPEAQTNALSKPFEESNEFEQNRQAGVEDASSMLVLNHTGATLLKKVVGYTASIPSKAQPEGDTQDMKDVPRLRKALRDMIENWKCSNIWTERGGFTAEVVQYKECGEECYKLLNQLYRRLQGSSIICPLCLCKSSSKPKSKSIESHFIPRAMLKVFRDIHGDGVDNFMYDISAGKTLGIGLRCPDMLCSGCENVSSKEEDKLRDVYLGILVETESNILTFKNAPTGWFQFILANIFFRGLLVGCDLKVELNINNRLFQDFFWRLKQYCNKENEVFPDIKLYILANKPLNPKMKNFVHALDMLARFPRFTELIRCETGMFLYCQFDCFHLVAPLDKCSIAHFKQYQNGLGLGSDSEQQVHIAQHGHCEVRKDRDTNILTYYIPAVADGLMYQFPEVLLQINAKDYSRVSPFVIEDQYRKRYKSDSTSTNPNSVSKLTDDVVSFVDRAPDCPPRFNLCTNTPGTVYRNCSPNRETTPINLQLKGDIILNQTETAFKLSPIAHYKRLEQLHAEEIEKMKSDQKNVIEKKNRAYKLLFMNELRHIIERRSHDSELVPPSIKEMFDSVSEYGESDKFICIAKQIISKTKIRRLSSVSVPWPDQSVTEIEQATTEYYHSCGILFGFIKSHKGSNGGSARKSDKKALVEPPTPSSPQPTSYPPTDDPTGELPTSYPPTDDPTGELPSSYPPTDDPTGELPTSYPPADDLTGELPSSYPPADDPTGELPSYPPTDDPTGELPTSYPPADDPTAELPTSYPPADDPTGELPSSYPPTYDPIGELPSSYPPTDDPTGELPSYPLADDPTGELPSYPPADDPTGELPSYPPADDPTGELPTSYPAIDDPTGERAQSWYSAKEF